MEKSGTLTETVLVRDEEANTLFKCTVLGFHDFHKWDGGGVPSQGMEFQDIPDGRGWTLSSWTG